MDTSKKYCNPSPENRASSISKLFFWWVIPFFKYGYSHNLGMKDVYNTMNSDKSEYLANELERNWKKVKTQARFQNTKPSLLTAIRNTFWKPFSIAGVMIMLRIVIYSYFMPLILSQFIGIFNEEPRNIRKGCYLGVTLISMNFLNCLIAHQGNLYTKRLGMRVRVACCSLIYRKVLKLNKTSLDDTDVGMLVNLLSNDVNRFDIAASLFHFIWIMPIQAVIGTYVMYDFVGAVAFVGIGAMVLQAVPVQGYFSRLQGKLRMEIASITDSRMKLMHEIISGIQMIKMYAWEKPFEKMVTELRKSELFVITRTSRIKACSTSVQVFTERVSLYIIVVTYVLTGNELTGSVVFSMSQAINFLQLVVCIMFPMALSAYAEAKASINRIENFLSKEEIHEIPKNSGGEANAGSVKFTNVNARWLENIETLIDVSFEIKPGSFCCIVGSVGSGKSSVLLSLLREIPITSGRIDIGGTISYASQESWIFGSDIRGNILFGQPFCKERYENVLEACALKKDLQNFLHGDNTTIGERGMTLSGGQRSRVGLARCVYREADIYLLDDPLSAVDPHVANRIVEKCILEFLKGKTRIVVTHHIEFLSHADVVLILKDGEVEKFLKPNELSRNELNIIRQTSNIELRENKLLEEKAESMLSLGSLDYENEKEEEEEENKTTETQVLIKKGLISFSVYKAYYRAGASTLILLFEMFLFLIAQSFCLGSDLWITYWTNNMDQLKIENASLQSNNLNSNVKVQKNQRTTNSSVDGEIIETVWSWIPQYSTEDLYIKVYTTLIIGGVALTIWRSIFFYKICMKSSENLHSLMFQNIMQAKMKFYDSTSSGKILNRFSKDMGAIDEQLPSVTLLSVQVILIGIGITTLVIIKSPWMAIPTVVIGTFVFWFRRVFLKGAQDVKRLEGKAKGPVFSYVASTLHGITTIRSANAEEVLKREFDVLQDQHTATWYLLLVLFDAFGFFLNTITIVFLLILTFQSLFDVKALSGDVGLMVSQSLIIIGVLQLGARNTADVASHMTSVERVLKYTKLDKEGPFESVCKPPPFWPQAGRIRFVNVNSTLSLDKHPVLRDVNIEIEPGEKIGVVGRTGAGKSSLISALFRLISIEGSIEIDGVDIMKVGLIDLRTCISVIPQEPVLFSGSIRYNLDPFGKCDDQALWQALYCVELRHGIDNLDMNVSEGGSNFSVGQRQLICLARAIIRDNKILVMDEATANVDPTTDALIQKSIRKNFKHCTVLTVAHRLNTIMDSDRVIVMDTGRVHEFAAPYELLQDPGSLFSRMVAKSGSVMETELKRIAKDHYSSKEQS